MKLKFLRDEIVGRALELAVEFSRGSPFPHVVLDDFFDASMLSSLLELYPSVHDQKWWVYDNPLEKKHAFNDLSQLARIFTDFFNELSSDRFVGFLERLSGLQGIIADPALYGAGLHQILPGGKLDVHEDFNIHRELRAHRRLNVITFLNKDWSDGYRGDLQLWNESMDECVRSIAPIFNRVVIFRTDMRSNHGHPEPLACPSDRSRKSIATYYYTPDGSIDVSMHRSTVYKKRVGDPDDPTLDELRERRKRGRVD